jgi:hypothetical protein
MATLPRSGEAEKVAGSTRPLFALLSQVLVAFTVEFDGEFERGMAEAGYPGTMLSLVMWANLLRFVPEGGISVAELATSALAPVQAVKFQLGCLERWGVTSLRPDAGDTRAIPRAMHRQAGRELRDGWGSGRGIRSEWMVRATAKGQKALEIWPTLFGGIEKRWEGRFGKREMAALRDALHAIADQLETELPDGVPHNWENLEFPRKTDRARKPARLPAVLSKLLTAFALEFDGESQVPLALCANSLRVLGDEPVRESDLARLTGTSPEMSDIGWRLEPFVIVEADPYARRGKAVRLNARGLTLWAEYKRLVEEIEERWRKRFGKDAVDGLRFRLESLFLQRDGDRLLMAEAFLPPECTIRAGHQAPALGRRAVAAAAKQRMRDMVEQTAAFVGDPANALPYFPLWDMNRGFGP